jgi:hypothetical protein
MTMMLPTIRKRLRPRDFHSPWSPQQQCEKLTALIQGHAPHALVTVSSTGCFYLLYKPYIALTKERQWAHGQMLGISYAEAATTLNRLYGASLDPERGNQWA